VKIKKPVIIVLGEPNSIFIEILSKFLKKIVLKKKLKYPIIIIGSKKLINSQLKVLKINLDIDLVNHKSFNFSNLKNKIYLIDIKYNFKKPFEPISKKSKQYISRCFETALFYMNSGLCKIMVNGPISKKHFLNKKYAGITEYIFHKSKKNLSKYPTMIIFNKKFSVSPITTHVPIKSVHKRINQEIIINNIININNFYKSKLNIHPKIAVAGLNPHCETKSKLNEENLFIKPALQKLKKKNIKVFGPFSADTFFLKKNILNYDCLVGMYHDQVLTPFKAIFGFDASNITLGIPFIRLSVDHGPNEHMIGKNKSSTESLENIFNLINSIK